MDEDRVVRLLEEVRDLQRQQVEAYARALANQQESVRMQREGLGRARRLLAVVGVITVLVLITVLVFMRYVLRHYS